jgi:probable F420-dependent oxidoreductase
MNIGVFQLLANSEADPAVVAAKAEELGFESYWVGDHTVMPVDITVPYPGVPEGEEPPDYLFELVDPLMALARASATTKKLLLGTSVCLVAERNPLLLAKQVATLDDASGGRVLLGVGGGWNPEECRVLGGDFEHRWAHVKDHVAAMKVLWTEDISEYHGRYADFPALRCYPKPARKPHPPVLIGSTGTKTTFKRVVEWGDGWMPSNVESIDAYAASVKRIKELAEEAGRDPESLDFGVYTLPGEYKTPTELDALAEAGAHRVIVWINELKLDGILAELEELAGSVLDRSRSTAAS